MKRTNKPKMVEKQKIVEKPKMAEMAQKTTNILSSSTQVRSWKNYAMIIKGAEKSEKLT